MTNVHMEKTSIRRSPCGALSWYEIGTGSNNDQGVERWTFATLVETVLSKSPNALRWVN